MLAIIVVAMVLAVAATTLAVVAPPALTLAEWRRMPE